MKYKVIDLFCGVGGFSYGFELTNKFDVVLGADIWDVALETFKNNHPCTNLINVDLRTVENGYWDKYKNTDVIIAGPPCQGFSMSGKRDSGDKRNTLFEEVVRISSIVQPKYVVMENVQGLLSMHNEDGISVVDLIYKKFNEIGYSVTHKILNSADYGVPQIRKRVVFLASKDYPLEYPEKIYNEYNYVSVGDALGNIDPDGDEYFKPNNEYQKLMSGKNNKIYNHDRRKSNDLVTKRMSYIPQGGNWKNIPEYLGTGGGTHSNAYKRLDNTKPSITIKHAAKAMIIHPLRNRILTCREVARLQSFPDDFIFSGTKSDQHQQLANAVPPLLGKAIAEQIYVNLESKKKIRFIDLFSGMGGFRLAFEKNNCECVFSSDIDDAVCETYEMNFGINPKSDITKINSGEIDDFDILCAGFPCQPFSIAGLRKGFQDTRGTLFFEVARIIDDKKPKAFLLENVKGIVNHDNGKTLDVILNTLDNLGYITKWEVLNAKDYGVPQNRERWYCIGIRKDLYSNNIDFPPKRELLKNLKDIIKINNDDCYKSTSKCIENIDLNLIKKGIIADDYTLAYEIRPSRAQFVTNYISPCLTAKMGTGGNNVPVVISQKRKLTEDECLQIMGFPPNYKVKKGYKTYKQIGNSVVVPVIEELAKIIVEYIGGNSNESNR